jgi:5-formyltetrahydrofolate cyclo-ligase
LENTKESVRTMIWGLMERNNISLTSCHGRIPNFHGSNKASKLLQNTMEWKNSNTIFVSPDTAQQTVRKNVIKDGKDLIMASPKLLNGYIKIEPSHTTCVEDEASTIKGAFKHGSLINSLPNIDMVVEGSVAVDMCGGRLGKGGGYGDMEISYLKNNKLIKPDTPIVTTVDEIQIIEKIPLEPHDEKINMIITPERIIRI